MTQHLCISVTLLDGMYHGKADGELPEWPPSPHRLFQALVAGSRTGGRARDWSDAKAEAFRWLERRDPPLIIAPDVHRSGGYVLFVPNNDGDRKAEREQRLTGKKVQPQFLQVEAPVHYLWSLGEEDLIESKHLVHLLALEVRHLFALGWGIDAAFAEGHVMNEVEMEQLKGIRWRPSAENGTLSARRVPVSNTLDDLEDVYRSFSESVGGTVYKPPRKPEVFAKIDYLRQSAVATRPYARFEFEDEVAFRQEEAAVVAAMLRSATCAAADEDTHDFPGGSEVYVAGHANGRSETPPRFSYLPLPSIGHPHSDGMIRRVLVAEPYGGDRTNAAWAERRLTNGPLVDESGEERTLLLSPSRTGQVWDRYLGEASLWSSVTPVILPGHDDRDPKRKAPALFLKALDQAGIPRAAVQEFHLRKAPSWPGSQHPKRYHRPHYLKHLPAWHVFIRFREPVRGPLAIGAGRHCGLGIFGIADFHKQRLLDYASRRTTKGRISAIRS